jgi:hypothetical protein
MKAGSKFNIDEYIREITVGADVLLTFKGALTERKADRILDDMEIHFNTEEKRNRQKILLTAHEILKNIIEHNEFPLHVSFFILSRKRQILTMDAGNVVTLHSRNIIEKRIREVNRRFKENQELFTNDVSTEKNEGLGFLEMRRKSGYPLDFSFILLDDDMYFYHLVVRFNFNEK